MTHAERKSEAMEIGRREGCISVSMLQRRRIRAITRTKLAGRMRWINPGDVVLVPKHGVTDKPLENVANV